MNAQLADSLLKTAEDAGPALRGIDSRAAFQQLDQEYGDLQLALTWFVEHRRADEALRLASALVAFWMATKRLDEGSTWLDRVLALTGGEDGSRGRALFDAGYLAFWRGEDARSASLQNRAVELGRRTNNPTVIALALVGLARIALRTNVEEARRLCREALAATEGTSDRLGRSSAMHVLAVGAQMAGDLLEARDLMSQRITLARETGNFAVVSSEAGNLCRVERRLGNLDRAEELGREALDIDRRRGDELAIPWKVNGLAAVTAARGEFARAAKLIGVADATMEAAGGAWPPDEWQQYEQTVTVITEAIGSTALDRERVVGRAMVTTEAIDFALGRGERAGSSPEAVK
jgi:tetratricopeptide (TPR) repeat protein